MPVTPDSNPHLRPPRYPFGNPDGARADLKEVMHGFVGLADESFHAALGDPAEDLSARIIIGRMGAGKTIYLRRSHAMAGADPATYADAVRNDLPSTDDVVDVCHRYEPETVEETWTAIWRRAILRALASHLLFAPSLRESVSFAARERLEEDFAALLGRPTAPRSPYAEVSAIIRKHRSRGSLDRYLKHPQWPDLTWHLSQALRETRPVYFHLDAVDEQFGRAPMYWLKLQKGLFHAVIDLLRDSDFGGRLHVVACVRDIVYSHILRSEHAGRYRDEPHIRVLDWNALAIRQLLIAKIGRLGAFHRMDPDSEDVAGWLGLREIDNPRRNVLEPVEDYLLRHTRMLPRDIVFLGNSLCREVARAKRDGATGLEESTIRRVVGSAAATFADMQLQACANQIAADMMPANAVTQRYAEVYLGDTEYSRGLAEELRKVIRSIGRDRFDAMQLDLARRDAGKRLEAHARPGEERDVGLQVLDVLWQQGLLGYQAAEGDEDDIRFFARADVTDFHLPMDRLGYVFHSCVAHSIPLEPVGPPVPTG